MKPKTKIEIVKQNKITDGQIFYGQKYQNI